MKNAYIKNHHATLRSSNIVPSASSLLNQSETNTSFDKAMGRTRSANATLPEDEVTVIIPPIDEPYFQDDEYRPPKKTLYGLCQSPHHCYNTIKGIILKIGLNLSSHDPCLISSVLNNPSSTDSISDLQSQLHIGLYLNNFVFYSSYPDQEAPFKKLLK